MFGSRNEAHRLRNGLFAYLIVVAWAFMWAGVTDYRNLVWWRQLGIIAIFSFLPYLFIRGLLLGPEEERDDEDTEA